MSDRAQEIAGDTCGCYACTTKRAEAIRAEVQRAREYWERMARVMKEERDRLSVENASLSAEVQRARDEERAKYEAEIDHLRAAWHAAESDHLYWYGKFAKLEVSRASCCDENEQAVARLRALVEQMREALVDASGAIDRQLIGVGAAYAIEQAFRAADKELGR